MESSVYFIQCETTQVVKIGVSSDPGRRLRQLQTACPGSLRLLHSFPGTAADEARIHRRFAGRRSRGEWFRISPTEIPDFAPMDGYPSTREVCGWDDMEHRDIRFLLNAAVGFTVSLAVRSEFGETYYVVEKPRGWDDLEPRGLAFQAHANAMGRIWAASPLEAAADFLAAWQGWIASGGDPN